jgi:hypothetical protein
MSALFGRFLLLLLLVLPIEIVEGTYKMSTYLYSKYFEVSCDLPIILCVLFV